MKLSFHSVGVLSIAVVLASFVSARLSLGDDKQPMIVDEQSRDYIEALPVKYVTRGAGCFAPAYVDSEKHIILVWREVNLKPDQVPNAGPQHRTPVIDLAKTDFAVREIAPRVRYIVDGLGNLQVGYYDRSSKTFFFWHGLEMKKPEAGFEAFEKNKVSDDGVRQKIDVPIPAWFWSSVFDAAR